MALDIQTQRKIMSERNGGLAFYVLPCLRCSKASKDSVSTSNLSEFFIYIVSKRIVHVGQIVVTETVGQILCFLYASLDIALQLI